MSFWRKLFCSHECYIADIQRTATDRVECKCHKCGLVLTALYGLALPCKLISRTEHSTKSTHS